MADIEEPPQETSEPTVEKVQAEQPAASSEPTEGEQKEDIQPTEELKEEEPQPCQDQPNEESTEPKTEEVVEEPPQEVSKEQEPAAKNGEVESKPQQAPASISGRLLRHLIVGMELQKAKKGTKVLPRLFSISNDLVRLSWNSKRKSQSRSQIPLSQIQDVLGGRQTDSFRAHQGTPEEGCCFSIIYIDGSHTKTLDLIAPNLPIAFLWISGLQALTRQGVSEGTTEVRQRWLRGIFDDADHNNDQTLDLKEVIQLMKKLNVGVSNKVIKNKFKQADTSGNSDNKLDFDEFCALFNDLADRPEMRKLFNLYASVQDGSYMSVEDLLSFLHNVQNNVEATEEYCQSVIERFEPSEEGKNQLLSLDGFTQYMLSDDNDLFKRSHSQIYQDMTQPLSHYFIASSHNTYLVADQLSGPSSVDAYIRALERGCRCVELDTWDGDDNEPIIYHGHTLTSKILFKDAIAAIKEYAFKATPYPLILSIENHCSVEQQCVMATHMIEIFGDLLYKDPRDEGRGVLPSPEDLKNKILIKAKKLPQEHEDKDEDEGEVSDEDEGAEIDPEELTKMQKTSQTPVATGEDSEPPPPSEDIPQGSVTQPGVRKIVHSEGKRRSTRRRAKTETVKKPAAKRKLSSKLSKCVNYIQSVHFKGFEHIVNVPFYHMSSFGESSAFKHSEEAAAYYIEYNKKHLSRTYPSGRRVDSSNYDPIDMWNAGCQIVALNYQTAGESMDWNIGKFQQNGGSGYILKPDIMREDFAHFNHNLKDVVSGVSPKLLTLRIISGQQLPKPEGGSETGEIIDPYVTVQIAGIPVDKFEYKTKVINDNGFNPVWNETIHHVIHFPELALMRIKVMDYDMLSKDDFIGQYTLPIASMETGYRHIHLRTTNWEPIKNATLFVEVTMEDWIGPPPRNKDKLRDATLKKSRQYLSMHPCHFPQLDGLLKTVSSTLRNGLDIREDFKFLGLLFKQACGKPLQAKLIECVMSVFERAEDISANIKLVPHQVNSSDRLVYQMELTSEITPAIADLIRMIDAFNRLSAHILTLYNLSGEIITEFENVLTEALRLKNDFNTAIETLPPKKADQAKMNYSWNIRTLRNESSEITRIVNEANEIIDKIPVFADKYSSEIAPLPKMEEQQPPQEESPQQSTSKETPEQPKQNESETAQEQDKQEEVTPQAEDTAL